MWLWKRTPSCDGIYLFIINASYFWLYMKGETAMNTVRKMVSLLMIVAFCIGVMPGAAMADSTSSTYSDAGIVSISAGASMSAAVLSDGTLWTWGCGERQLSVYGGSRKDIRSQSLGLAAGAFVPSTPMMVISNSAKSVKCSMYCGDTKFLGWADVGLYGPMTAVLRNDDTLWMWGSNGNGALGNGSTDYSWRPVKVLDNVVSYDASGHHSAAVTSDGALYTWGSNNYGQLGDGTTESSLSPKKIEGMENVVAVSLGEYHSAALKADGTLWIWGSNTYGQLGDGTTDNSLVPKQILTNVKDVSLGDYYSMALKTDGTVWVWGNNYDGRLGLGGSHQTPSLNENIEDICSIEAGTDFSAAIDTDGNLWMWGSNRNGKLGNGSSANTLYTPEIVMEDVEQVALGQAHALALKKDGSLWAWGSNYEGELGDFTTTSKSYPVQIYLGQIQATFGANDSSEAQAKTLLVPWSDAYLYADSSIYNKNLAIDGIVLSEAAYNSPGTVFAQFGFSYADSEYNGKYPSYYVGYRATYDFDNPHVEIMMAIRGTKGNDDILSDLRSHLQ